MNPVRSLSPHSGAPVKQARGWFAAGDGFRQALLSLSDGAFKLFAHLCLEADRQRGRYEATHQELAAALGKCKRIIGRYVAELEQKQMARVSRGKNQFAPTVFEIADPYWPYQREEPQSPAAQQEDYVEAVRKSFLAVGCVRRGGFRTADVHAARALQQRALPLELVQNAVLLGACRKYVSWLEGRCPEPIHSLSYFEPLIAEIQQNPLPAGYSTYLRNQVKQLAAKWGETVKARQSSPGVLAQKSNQQTPKTETRG